MIDEILREFIRAGLDNDRVYSHRAPQNVGEEPYIVLYRITGSAEMMQTGPSATVERLYQFSAYGASQSATMRLIDDLRQLLNGFSGWMQDNATPVNQAYVSSVVWTGESYGYNDTTKRHHFEVDLRIRFIES